ncbi:hypothetical protein [Mycoplana dimorpha]|uniref:hypothetical protein n=1 Tax=Mycoplana dimorpha TaxID=28320 RepID=UPI0014742588|nr:hypothetical protein [Mycoplana dimorpha]
MKTEIRTSGRKLPVNLADEVSIPTTAMGWYSSKTKPLLRSWLLLSSVQPSRCAQTTTAVEDPTILRQPTEEIADTTGSTTRLETVAVDEAPTRGREVGDVHHTVTTAI